MRRTIAAIAALTLLGSMGLAACGGDDTQDSTQSGSTDQNSSAPASTSAESVECSDDATIPAASNKVGQPPEIAKPSGAPPCDLVVKDLAAGTGEEVTDTSKVYEWNYEGVAWSTGEIFDSSFQRGAPVPFALDQVIEGWKEGLQGMKVGGRRQLVIPPDQAYGEAGAGASIGPNETLVFVVDLVGPAG